MQKRLKKNLNSQIHTQTEFPTNAENADEKMIHVNDGPALSVVERKNLICHVMRRDRTRDTAVRGEFVLTRRPGVRKGHYAAPRFSDQCLR